MRAHGFAHLLYTTDDQMHPITDGKACVLAGTLHLADQLPGRSFTAQFVSEGRIDRGNIHPVASDHEIARCGTRQEHVIDLQCVLHSLDHDRDRLALLQVKAILAILLRRYDFEIEVVDVDSRPELEEKWGDKVPVLLDGERELCHYYLDIEAVDARLARMK